MERQAHRHGTRHAAKVITSPAATALAAAAAFGLLLISAAALADHPGTNTGVIVAPTATVANSGGEGAEWELITSIYSGNPHSDLDFFELNNDYYVAVGTLAAGANDGGQMIHRLTVDGIINPSFVSSHPSAACVSSPLAATGLQHDVEVTPKGRVLLNTDWGGKADTRPPQLLIDATDADGRCHDQNNAGAISSPNGGLELVDITDVANPVEIGLVSHVGEAHTVNVSPSRSHIAYVSSSDGSIKGIEFVDMSSCMNFPDGTSLQDKRDACRPEVYRYIFDSSWARGTLTSAGSGCHELEVYPDDKLTCASIEFSVVLDMSGAFDDNGTPDDYTDDKLRGTPLPCSVRESESNAEAAFATGAMVVDCTETPDGGQLNVIGWQGLGSPSVEGIEMVGVINHAGTSGRSAGLDIAISHEAELSASGRFLIVTDERGGGIVPPGAACPTPGTNDGNDSGNGGIHAYVTERLPTVFPGDPSTQTGEQMAQAADAAYALTPSGEKAIFRAIPRVGQGSLCTAHVFHQIPGQNRIFMGWYSQGTHVVDFTEHEDGTLEFHEAAWWVPESAATWTSAIFGFHQNLLGRYTYYGATADFGRQAVDIFSVTLPAPPEPLPMATNDNDAGANTPGRSTTNLPPVSTFDRGGGVSGGPLLVLLCLAGLALLLRRGLVSVRARS